MNARKLIAYLSLCAGLIVYSHQLLASDNTYEDKENSPPRTPTGCHRSSLPGSVLKDFNQIYGLEEEFIDVISAKKRSREEASRDMLGEIFEEIIEDPKFKKNYRMVEEDGHQFFIPKILWHLQDPLQLARLAEGKSIISPTKGNSFHGHHIQMRDPSTDQPTYVWVITRTNHKGRHNSLHVPVKKSKVTRSRFKSAQQQVYKGISRELSTAFSSEEETV